MEENDTIEDNGEDEVSYAVSSDDDDDDDDEMMMMLMMVMDGKCCRW